MESFVDWALDNDSGLEQRETKQMAKEKSVVELASTVVKEINTVEETANTTTDNNDDSTDEKIKRFTSEDWAYYRSQVYMQMYDEQSEIAEELLDDTQLGKLYRITRRYLKTGIYPDYGKIEDKLLLSQVKSWISAIDLIFDYKVRQSVKSRGKGAPKGNQNARKKRIKVSDGVKQTKTN